MYLVQQQTPSKERILSIAARDSGLVVNIFDRGQQHLKSRMKIFSLRGLVYEQRHGNNLHYKLAKDTLLL